MSVTATSRAVWIVPAVLLVIAIGDWPYGNYQIVRFVVCGACAYLAYVEYQTNRAASVWGIAFGAIALLFNPIAPIHLNKDIWRWLDGSAAVALIAHLIFVRERRRAA